MAIPKYTGSVLANASSAEEGREVLVRDIARYLTRNPGDGRQQIAEIKKRWPKADWPLITRAFGIANLVIADVLHEKADGRPNRHRRRAAAARSR
jgi:hypothetical protein